MKKSIILSNCDISYEWEKSLLKSILCLAMMIQHLIRKWNSEMCLIVGNSQENAHYK